MDKKKVLCILSFILVIVLAVWLRVLYADAALWYDEACSWVTAKKDFPFGIIQNLMTVDLQHTPLYFFLLHFWMKLFGEGEVSIRILSLIFAISAVPLSFCVAKKLMSQILALIVSAVIAVNPLLVYFAPEVRMYPMVLFLVLLSFNYFIDFDKNHDAKSLIKLVIVNVLIPYTFVGGILYNISVALSYIVYLAVNKYKERILLYLKGLGVEICLLIPYWLLIFYYANLRSHFIVKHEGSLYFYQIVEVIRNFFGVTLVNNLYWPSVESYNITLLFTIFVILPCVYFLYGFVQGIRKSDGFLKVLYFVVIVNFVLFILCAAFQINVFTIRYILYLLPLIFILSFVGLEKKLSSLHLKIFSAIYIISAIVFTINYYPTAKALKVLAFKSVQIQSNELGLTADDILIMPFGADAPYYFRFADTPRVLNFDFHKEARNPYNDKLYDKSQQEKLSGKGKYSLILDTVFKDSIISENFYNYFVSNVNYTVPSGRYVLMAFYAQDAVSVVSLESLRAETSGVRVVMDRTIDILLKKFVYDMRFLLSVDFELVKTFKKDNYTYLLYRKK
ncbi:MAG: glycosyltransferase family 39 protein [Candidatus Gastranaerophilaceae bacterium]